MATMTKKKIISTISQDHKIHPNHVRTVIQNFLDKMTDALVQGDRLEFRDFGVLQCKIILEKFQIICYYKKQSCYKNEKEVK